MTTTVLKSLLSQIETKVESDTHTSDKLYMSVAMLIGKMAQTHRASEEEITNLCACLLRLYLMGEK